MYYSPLVRGCDAVVTTVKGGDPAATEMKIVYVFTSERRAERALDTIEEAIWDSSADIDIERIEAKGEFVELELTIHHE